MANAIIAAAASAALFLLLGLDGCSPGTVIWVIPKEPPTFSAAKGGGSPLAGGTVGASSHLTALDRQQLTKLLEKLR